MTALSKQTQQEDRSTRAPTGKNSEAPQTGRNTRVPFNTKASAPLESELFSGWFDSQKIFTAIHPRTSGYRYVPAKLLQLGKDRELMAEGYMGKRASTFLLVSKV